MNEDLIVCLFFLAALSATFAALALVADYLED